MKKSDNSEVKIIHIMADGTARDSIDGYVVPYNETTKRAFELIAKYSGQAAEKAAP